MSSLFKRNADMESATDGLYSAGSSPPSATLPTRSGPELRALPLPEVTEGNLESDWALWEDSVAFQDSQMPSGFAALDSVRERGKGSADASLDPFASVRRRGT